MRKIRLANSPRQVRGIQERIPQPLYSEKRWIGNRLKKRKASALALIFLLASGAAQAKETLSATEIASLLPSIRGLDFDEPRLEIEEKGAIAPEYWAEQQISLIALALAWLGTPYQLGGFSKSGVDCSGFIHRILVDSLPELGPFPRRSDGYAFIGQEASAIEPGDILLFAQDKTIYHVALALSSTTFIHSASEGSENGSNYFQPQRGEPGVPAFLECGG